MFALLGLNGAGKTTTLEILEGFRKRDTGDVPVLGLDPAAKGTARQLREQIGLVLQEIAVEPYLRVRETVARNAGYYPHPRDIDEVIGMVGLEGKEKETVPPAPAWLMFGGLLAHCVFVSFIDVAVIVGMSRIYGNSLPSRWDVIVVTVVIGAAAFCALGVAVASLISNAEAAPAVVQFIFFPLVFISGTYFNITSKVLNTIAGIFPVRPFNQALLKVFAFDGGYDWKHLGVLAAWGVGGAMVAIRRFRWDPRPE